MALTALNLPSKTGVNVNSDGSAFWTHNGEMRREGLLQLTEASEYKIQIDSEVTLALIYQGLLGRAPDQTGFDAWQTALQQGLDETPVI